MASQNGHTEVVKLLHEYGAQVDLQNKTRLPALILASLNRHTEAIKLLHEYRAQIDKQDKKRLSQHLEPQNFEILVKNIQLEVQSSLQMHYNVFSGKNVSNLHLFSKVRNTLVYN